jgi:hypothetical protein
VDSTIRPASLFGAFALPGAWSLPKVVVTWGLFLILYLPIELALIGGLPEALYWTLRLLPDAITALLALAVVVLGDRRARTTPVRIMWIVAAVCGAIILVNAARGISVVDSINALRVLTRYLVLGLMVWWAAAGRWDIRQPVIKAVLLAGLMQLVFGAIDVLSRLVLMADGSIPAEFGSLFFIDGTLGRYDRFGLLLMTFVLAVVAASDRLDRRQTLVVAAGLALLYLSTSRQAMVGLGIASLLMAVLPHTLPQRRVLAVAMAVAAVAFVIGTPSRLPPPPTGDPDGAGSGEAGQISGEKGDFSMTLDPKRNFRLFYNLEVMPWAAVTEPVVGFGPRQHVAEFTDPRLIARFEAGGMKWDGARRFTNDSNYAAMVVQFGVVAPTLFLVAAFGAVLIALREAWRKGASVARFAALNGVAVIFAAATGPDFEIRPTSIVFWLALSAVMVALSSRGRSTT